MGGIGNGWLSPIKKLSTFIEGLQYPCLVSCQVISHETNRKLETPFAYPVLSRQP
jgi:hypothetical protein